MFWRASTMAESSEACMCRDVSKLQSTSEVVIVNYNPESPGTRLYVL